MESLSVYRLGGGAFIRVLTIGGEWALNRGGGLALEGELDDGGGPSVMFEWVRGEGFTGEGS